MSDSNQKSLIIKIRAKINSLEKDFNELKTLLITMEMEKITTVTNGLGSWYIANEVSYIDKFPMSTIHYLRALRMKYVAADKRSPAVYKIEFYAKDYYGTICVVSLEGDHSWRDGINEKLNTVVFCQNNQPLPLGQCIGIINLLPGHGEILFTNFNQPSKTDSILIENLFPETGKLRILTSYINPETDYQFPEVYQEELKKEDQLWINKEVEVNKNILGFLQTCSLIDPARLFLNNLIKAISNSNPKSDVDDVVCQFADQSIYLNLFCMRNEPAYQQVESGTHGTIFVIPSSITLTHRQIDQITELGKIPIIHKNLYQHPVYFYQLFDGIAFQPHIIMTHPSNLMTMLQETIDHGQVHNIFSQLVNIVGLPHGRIIWM